KAGLSSSSSERSAATAVAGSCRGAGALPEAGARPAQLGAEHAQKTQQPVAHSEKQGALINALVLHHTSGSSLPGRCDGRRPAWALSSYTIHQASNPG